MTYEAQTNKPRRPLVPSPSAPPERLTGGLGHVARVEEKPPGFMISPIGKIAGAVAGVMAEVGTINKGGYNTFHRYNYARMEDLLVALTPLIGKHGLAIFQNEIEIKTIENRIAVTYEFAIAHSSGEMWPEKPRFTGMCIARNSKGDYDDKALNKCHTQARKYFLLSLFQVPAGDFEEDMGDSDKGPSEANQRVQAPVPGPGKNVTEPLRQGATVTSTGGGGGGGSQEGVPHKIVLGPGAGADQWGSAFIRMIGKAKSVDEIKAWDTINNEVLQRLSENFPQVYAMLETAMQRRLDDLQAARDGLGPIAMPDPKADPQVSMNWVAEQLQQLKSYEAAEAFWNTIVAPREQDFDEVDWGMLMEEWKRAETRLAPEPPEAEPT